MKCLQKSGIGPISLLALLALTLCFASEPVAAQAAPTAVPGAGTQVLPGASGWSRTGAANNAYGVYEDLQRMSSTGRQGYPSIPAANRASMSAPAARTAMRGVWRALGWAGVALAVVELAGQGYDWLQCSTNGICKPGSADWRPDYSGGNGYCYSRFNGSFCVDAANLSVAPSAVRAACTSNVMCDWAGYNQTVTSSNCGLQGVIVVWCEFHYKQGSDPTDRVFNFVVTGTSVSSGQPHTGAAPVPVTDADLESAAGALMASHPAQFIDDLKAAGAWNPDKHEMSAPVPSVEGAPVIRELPEDKPGAPNGKKIEEIKPNTAAKASPDKQAVNVYNYNVTTVTHTDGTTETSVAAESPNLDIPDDYAREQTQQDIAEDVAEIRRQLEPDDLPDLGDAPTFADSMQRLRTRLAESPIGRAVEEAKPDSDTVDGICPVGNFTVFGQAFSIDAHCDLYEANSSLITGAMWAVWIIAAILFFMSA